MLMSRHDYTAQSRHERTVLSLNETASPLDNPVATLAYRAVTKRDNSTVTRQARRGINYRSVAEHDKRAVTGQPCRGIKIPLRD